MSETAPTFKNEKIDYLGSYENRILIGSAKGIALGFVSSYFICNQLKRRWVGWNELNVSAKMLFILSPPTALGIAGCEQAYLNFQRDIYAQGLNTPVALARQKRINELPFTDKVLYFGHRHRFKIIVGVWATSLSGAWYFINKDRLMTHPQKIVQARMYAQLIAIALLLGSLAVSYSNSGSAILKAIEEDDKRAEKNVSDDWKQIIADEEKRLQKIKKGEASH